MKRMNLNILVVEDSPREQLLLRRAFKSCAEPGLSIQATGSGNEAIRYLTGEGRFHDRMLYPYPSSLITDLKMPDGDGLSVLAHLQKCPPGIIPIVVLSDSNEVGDVDAAYALGASAYLVKPRTYADLLMLLRCFLDFWKSCEVPTRNGPTKHHNVQRGAAPTAGARLFSRAA